MVAHQFDEHADALVSSLERRSLVSVLRCSAEDVLAGSFSSVPGDRVVLTGRNVRGWGTSGLWRRPGIPDASTYAPEFRDFVTSEANDAFRGALWSLPIAWLSSPSNLVRAELKQVQLAVALALDVPFPETLVTSDQQRASEFLNVHKDVVAKPVRYGLVSSSEPPRVAFTSVLTDDLLTQWDGSPVVLQKRVRVQEHLRVVTVQERTWVASLTASQLDWREHLDNHAAFSPVSDHDHDHVRIAAQLVAHALMLGYSAQDWVIAEGGAFYFLEANPNGQWLFLDGCFEGEITTTLARSLEEMAQRDLRA